VRKPHSLPAHCKSTKLESVPKAGSALKRSARVGRGPGALPRAFEARRQERSRRLAASPHGRRPRAMGGDGPSLDPGLDRRLSRRGIPLPMPGRLSRRRLENALDRGSDWPIQFRAYSNAARIEGALKISPAPNLFTTYLRANVI
jgi:hypothetical protein